jgi:hypothetical protein
MAGVLEKIAGDSFLSPKGRYAFTLTIQDADHWELVDEAEAGVLPIDELLRTREPPSIVVTSTIPVRLTVPTHEPALIVVVAREPHQVKRFGRWRDVGPVDWPSPG